MTSEEIKTVVLMDYELVESFVNTGVDCYKKVDSEVLLFLPKAINVSRRQILNLCRRPKGSLITKDQCFNHFSVQFEFTSKEELINLLGSIS